MLSHFDLENLGNSLIALASNSISQTIMEELIRKSREEVLNKYVSNVLEQYKQFQEMKARAKVERILKLIKGGLTQPWKIPKFILKKVEFRLL